MLNGIKRKLMISFLTLLVLLIIYLIPTNKDIEILKENNEIKTQKVFLLNNNVNIYLPSRALSISKMRRFKVLLYGSTSFLSTSIS